MKKQEMKKYSRILLKLSGESLAGPSQQGIDPVQLNVYARQVLEVANRGVQVGVVIGAGNIFRGLSGVGKGFDRVKGDQMGMLGTTINSVAMHSAIEALGGKAAVLTAIRMEPVGEFYSAAKATELMNAGYVVILAGGTGNPYFTTDTAAALRAVEIKADVMLKGTRVDGVYTADPEKDPKAVKFDEITYDECYSKGLNIADMTAFTLLKENNMPMLVFDMNKEGNLVKIISGEKLGTLVRI
jgi:uridylate kinase